MISQWIRTIKEELVLEALGLTLSHENLLADLSGLLIFAFTRAEPEGVTWVMQPWYTMVESKHS